MDLEKLIFSVDTKQLDDAMTKLGALATATQKVNKPIKETTKVTEEAAEATKKATKAKQESTKAEEKHADAAGKTTSVLQRQQDILKFQTEGYSRGQSAILATAKAHGALADEIRELGKVLTTQRTLMGTDPFDKSIGAMQSLRNEYIVMKEIQRLYNAELGLTKSQMTDLARDKIRLIEQYKIEGKTLTDIKNGIRELNLAYISNANAENTLVASMKNRQKEAAATVKANEYITRELEKVRYAAEEMNKEFSRGSVNSILRFEQALKKSGMTVAEQTKLLDEYRAKQLSLQQAHGNKQVDYLSRALGPQITDVFVGLATGQSPLMVLLQQGGQLRDQFALAGVAGADMAKTLTTAAASMIGSVRDMAIAIGGLMVNAFVGAGKAVVNFVTDLTGFSAIMQKINSFIAIRQTTGQSFMGLSPDNLKAVSAGLASVANVAASVVTVAFVAASVALAKFTTETDKMVKSLYQSGGGMAISKDAAIALADTMALTGARTTTTMKIFGEMSKTGKFLAADLVTVASSAALMEKTFGVASKETVDMFAKMRDNPAKELQEFAQATGYVNGEVLKTVISLTEQGRSADASTIAIAALAAAQSQMVSGATTELSSIDQLWKEIKEGINNALEAVTNLGRSDAVAGVFRTAWQTVSVIISEVWFTLKGVGKEIGGIAAQLGAVIRGDFAGAAEIGKQMKVDAVSARKEQDALVQTLLGRNAAIEKGNGLSAQDRQNNSEIAKIQAQAAKAREMSLSKEAKILQEIRVLETQKANALKNGISGSDFDAAIAKKRKELADIERQRAKDVVYPGREAADAWADAYKNAKNILDDATGAVNKLNRAEQALMEYRQSNFFSQHSKEMQDFVITQLEQASAAYKQADADKEAAKAKEQLEKAQERYTKAYETFANQLASVNLRSEEEARSENASLQLRLDILGKTAGEAYKINKAYEYNEKLAKIELDYNKESLKIKQALAKLADDPAAYAAAIVAQMKLDEDRAERLKALNKAVAVQAAEDMQKEFDRISNSLADAITTALFEGGKAGKQKLRDLIVAEFRKPITIAIQATVSTVMQGITGGITNSLFGGGNNGLGIFNKVLGSDGGIGAILGGGFGGGAGVSTAAQLGTGFEAFMGSQGILASSGGTTAGLLGMAGSAIPYIGAAIGLASMFESPRGGPKTEGGSDIAKSITEQYKTIASAFGLDSSGVRFGAFSSQDTMGDALTQLQVAAFRNEDTLYSRQDRVGNYENVGRSQEELQAAIGEETVRAIFAALKAGGLEQKYLKYIEGVENGASLTDMQAALQRLNDARVLEERLVNLTATEEEKLAESRRKELANTDPLLRALLQQIYAQEDLTRATERANEAMRTTRSGLESVFSMASDVLNRQIGIIEREYDAAKKALDLRMETTKKSSEELKKLDDLLKNTLSKYNTDEKSGMSRLAATVEIDKAIALARTGSFVGADSLKDSLDVFSRPSENLYRTLSDYVYGRKLEQNKLQELQDLTGVQLSTEEQSLIEMKRQGETLEATKNQQVQALRDLIQNGRDQIDALFGIQTATLGVKDAIAMFNAAITAASGKINIPGGGSTSILTDAEIAGFVTPRLGISEASNREIYDAALANKDRGVTLERLDQIAGLPPGTAAAWAISNGLQTFNTGGYSSGMRPALVGETGKEFVDFQQPARIYTASQTRGMFAPRGDEIAELQRLNNRLERVEAALISIALTNNTVAKNTTEIKDRGVIALNNPTGEVLEVN